MKSLVDFINESKIGVYYYYSQIPEDEVQKAKNASRKEPWITKIPIYDEDNKTVNNEEVEIVWTNVSTDDKTAVVIVRLKSGKYQDYIYTRNTGVRGMSFSKLTYKDTTIGPSDKWKMCGLIDNRAYGTKCPKFLNKRTLAD